MEKNMEKKTYDIAVLGGSIGGVMAAFSAGDCAGTGHQQGKR